MNVHGTRVVGVDVDEQTRCAHYHTDVDVIALKFSCCDTYYPCYQCHEELADHAAEVWPLERADEKAVLCGVCKTELTVPEYIRSGYICPHCRAAFNPRCERHYNLYFAAPLYHALDMHIRLATPVDAHGIQAVMMDAYGEYRDIPGSSSALSETPEQIVAALSSGDEQALACFIDDTAVGCVRFQLRDGVYFYRLSVRTAYQGCGIAKALLSRLESWAFAHGQSELWCKVRYAVTRNVHLYQSLGYQKQHEEVIHKEGGVTLLVWTMRKNLTSP